MNATVAKLKPDADDHAARDPLAGMRAPFPANQVSKLPKPTKAQTDAVKADFKKGVRCKLCGAWHHPEVVHLDYVGHAALTDRLLDTDPLWSWEPMATRDGLPAFDPTGGLWIKLTVCGVTRLGYGHAAVKPTQDPGSREKEVIGDALRNAAMRFGAALDLWHKGDLHAEEASESAADVAINLLRGSIDPAWFKEAWEKNKRGWHDVMDTAEFARVVAVKDEMVAKFKADIEAAKNPLGATPMMEGETPFDDDLSVLGDDKVHF